MKRFLGLVLVISIFLFLISSCGSDSPQEGASSHDPNSNQETVPASETSPADLDDQRSQLEILTLEPAVLSAGDPMQISSQQALNGELSISRNGESIFSQPFSGSNAALTLPAELTDGQYVIEVLDQGTLVAIATFRVSAKPGIWLSSTRSFTGQENPAIIRFEEHQIPKDAFGAIYLTDPTGTSTPFVPDESGNLIAGLAVPVTEFLDRDLYLAAADNSTLQFKANLLDDPDVQADQSAPTWSSNSITITSCDQPSRVSGTMPGSGYVNAIWINGQIFTDSLYTADGTYELSIGPGFAIIQTLVETSSGFDFDQQVIGTTCGEEIQLASDLTLLPRGSFQPEEIRIASADLHQFPLKPNSHQELQGSQDEICRRGLLDASVTLDGKFDLNLSRAAELAMKTSIASTSPHISVVTKSDIADLINMAARESQESGEPPNLEHVSTALSTDFLIRLTTSTLGESFPVLIRSIKSNPGDQQVTASGNTSPELLGQTGNPIYQDFSEKFSHSAICGQVNPEQQTVSLGEEVPLEYKVHDLAGENVNGASVTISKPQCGTLEPEEGSIDAGIFKTTYKFPEDQFCKEALEFSAEWDGSVGKLKTKPKEAIARISPQLAYMELSTGHIPGIGSKNANIVEVATFYETWEEARAPGGLPAIAQTGDCSYVEGGQKVVDDFWYQTVSSPGKRAESSFSILAFSDLTNPLNHYSTTPADHVMLRMQTYAYAVPVEDDTPAREASAYSGNGSIISMDFASTAFVIDIYNPGELPVVPIIQWNSSVHNDDADFGGYIFYKIINCGTDAGLDSYLSFLGSNIREVYYFDAESGGDLSGLETLPVVTEKRTQLLLYIVNYSVATSIRDDADGIYHASMNKLNTEVDIYLSQEINKSD